jgi:hypothetical protein
MNYQNAGLTGIGTATAKINHMYSKIIRPEWIPSAYREEVKKEETGSVKIGTARYNTKCGIPAGYNTLREHRNQKRR